MQAEAFTCSFVGRLLGSNTETNSGVRCRTLVFILVVESLLSLITILNKICKVWSTMLVFNKHMLFKALLLHQRARMERLAKELKLEKEGLELLKAEVNGMEHDLMQRRLRRVSCNTAIPTVSQTSIMYYLEAYKS